MDTYVQDQPLSSNFAKRHGCTYKQEMEAQEAQTWLVDMINKLLLPSKGNEGSVFNFVKIREDGYPFDLIIFLQLVCTM